VSLVVVAVLWELIARTGLIPAYFLPSLTDIAAKIGTDVVRGPLLAATGMTLYRMLVAYGAAAVVGITLGVAMGRVGWVRWFFDPLISLGFPAPKISFLPVLILWFGLSDLSKIVLTALDCVFPIVSATYLGTQGVERTLVWSALNLGTRERALLWKVLVPAALPQVLSGLQVALPVAFIVMIVSEMLTGSVGLGGYIGEGYRFAVATTVFAGLVVTGALGYLALVLFARARQWLLVWHEEAAS
jgi:taurine transport system permease protein